MSHSGARVMRASLVVICCLALAFLSTTWWLFRTTSGARWVLLRASELGGKTLTFSAIEGCLAGPLSVQDLRFAGESSEVLIERVDLNWRPRALLHRRLHILDLNLRSPQVLLHPRRKAQKAKPSATPTSFETPLDVRVDRLQMVDLVVDHEEVPYCVASTILLVGEASASTIRIHELNLERSDGSAALSGEIVLAGAFPLDVDFLWDAPDIAGNSWTGEGQASGSLNSLSLQHELSGPATMLLFSRVDSLLSAPVLDATIDIVVPSTRALLANDEVVDLALDGQARIRGRPDHFSADLTITGEGAVLWTPTRVAAVIDRSGDLWGFRGGVFDAGSSTRIVEANGRLQTSGQAPEFTLHGAWRELGWPLGDQTSTTRTTGSLSLSGTLEQYDVEGEATFRAASIPEVRVVFAGRGDRDGCRIGRAQAQAGAITLTARGQTRWRPRVEWDLGLEGAHVEPATLLPGWEGMARARARVLGGFAHGTWNSRLTLEELQGRWRGLEVSGHGAASLGAHGAVVDELQLRLGGASARARGQVGELLDLSVGLRIPECSDLSPAVRGALQAGARVEGLPAAPQVFLLVGADSLRIGAVKVEQLLGELNLDLAPGGRWQGSVEAERVCSKENWLDLVGVHLDGSATQHVVSAQAIRGDDEFRIDASGGWRGSSWTGTINRLDLASESTGVWALLDSTAVRLAPAEVRINDLVWEGPETNLCVDASWVRDGPWTLRTDLDDAIPVLMHSPMIAFSMQKGRLSAFASVAGSGAQLIDGALAIHGGPIQVGLGGTSPVIVDTVILAADLSPRQMDATFDLIARDIGTLHADGQVAGGFSFPIGVDTHPIHATLRMVLPDLTPFGAAFPGLARAAGAMDGLLSVSGSLNEPLFEGRAALERGRIVLPRFGVDVNNIQLHVETDDQGIATIRGQATSGRGGISVEGQVQGAGARDPLLSFDLSGRNFQLLGTKEAKVEVSPELHGELSASLVSLRGDVLIPRARFRAAELVARMPIRPSNNVVFVNEEISAANRSGPAVRAEIRLILGDKVTLDTRGLSAGLTGSLLVTQDPGSPARATGELMLKDAVYKAYGQNLEVEHGRLIYGGGALTNPAMEVRASRRVRESIVGFEISGTVEAPELTLFSQPTMPEADILSYLVLGRALGESTASDQNRLADAATALGVKGGDLLARRLARRVGLDEAKIEANGAVADAALVLGVYLSPRMYVSYGVGLFQAVQTWRFRYDLSRSWALEATSGPRSSADVLYSIER